MNQPAQRMTPSTAAVGAAVYQPAPRSALNHRWGHRLSVDIDVQLLCPPRMTGLGRLTDMSVSGAFVETDLDLPLLSAIRVLSELRNGHENFESHTATAYVVRRSRAGIGIEWLQLAPALVRAILAEPLSTGTTPSLQACMLR